MDFIEKLEALVASLKEAAAQSAQAPATDTTQQPAAQAPATADTTLLNNGLTAQEIAAIRALVAAQSVTNTAPTQPAAQEAAKAPIIPPTPVISPQPSSVSFTPAQAALFLAQYRA